MIDGVAVLGGDFNGAIELREVRGAAEVGGYFVGPGFEAGAVRLIADTGDHEVGEVAKLVGQSVDEARVGVDDFFCEFDGRIVLDY